jgi:trimeric autotransporter adhesin
VTSTPSFNRFVMFISSLLLSVFIGCGGGGGNNGGGNNLPNQNPSNPTPVVSGISPNSSLAGSAATQVTVSGSGFVSGSTVQWNSTSRPTTFVSSTDLQVTATVADLASAGVAQVAVVNPSPGGGTSATMTFTINNPAPAVTSANPSAVIVGSSSVSITLTGTGFVPQSIVQWNGSARATTYVSATQIQVILTAADVSTAGTGQFSILNPSPGGGTSSILTFTANNPAPVVTAANPSTLLAGSNGTSVTLTGTGFIPQSIMQWNGSARATTYVSATQLQATLTAADVANGGTAQISILNPAPGGGISSNLAFTINNPAPSATSANPSTVFVGTGVSISLTGTGFVPQSVAQWNGSARTTTYVSGTQLQVALNASDVVTSGTGSLTVVNAAPGGGTSTAISIAVKYAVPAIGSLSPNSAVMGSQAVTMNVGGTGFAPASSVNWNGTPLPTTYLSGSVLSAVIPAADLVTNGTAQVTVVNPVPGGGTSNATTFTITTYPVPVISNISPTSVYVNSGTQTITVNGTGLQLVSVVQVNGTNVPTFAGYCWYSSDICSLLATVDASYFTSSGSVNITVYTPPPSGGVSNSATLTVSAPPAPTLNSISPNSAPIGNDDITLTVSGSNFTATSVVLWNGSARPTQYGNSTSLTATISKRDVATFGVSQVSVSTPAPGGGTSTTLPFSTYLGLPANDLVYSSATQLLYASVPSSGGPTLGNSIVSIDPNTGLLGSPVWVGSEPNRLGLSADGLTLWVGLDGASGVRKVDLNTGTAGTQFYLGGGSGLYNSPYKATAIAVMPGSPNTVAVTNSAGTIAIYDSGIARAKTGTAPGYYSGMGIAFDNTGSVLYAAGGGYSAMQVDSTGISSSTVLNSSVTSSDLRYDNRRAYLTSGVVLDAPTGNQLGVFSVSASQVANGPVAPDSAIGRAFMLVNPNYFYTYQINVYDLSSFVLLGSIPVPFAQNPYPPTPSRLVRWGQDGLAIPYGSQIYILRSTWVRDLSSTLADVAVSVSAPSSVASGNDVTYSVTVTNGGPSTANPVTLLNFLPDGTTFKSVTASQGTCAGGMVVRCNLGSMSSSGTATLQITATMLAAGTLTNTATASAAQGDSNMANNTASTDIVVTGSAYGAAPVLYSITPSLAQAGATSFTLTANGDNFNNASTIEWNGAALATTFVSSSQLTAQVDSSKVAGLGWAWVNINTPAPGGGNSLSLPFTTFQAINISTNDIIFDPFTRKIYGSVPSTATQVTGNSIVAIDPFPGTIGTPMPIGSEPHRLAESDDGKYLYIGLDGAKSLTRLDLTTPTPTQGPVYPLSYTSYGQANSFAAGELAVMPGNNSSLAVNTGYNGVVGILDVAGSTATMRPTIVSGPGVSSLTLPNSSTLYSVDTYSSGAMFYRSNVTGSGVTSIDSSTLPNMGLFRLVNGLVYGVNGGVADPSTTPPSLLAVNAVSGAVTNNTLQTSGIVVDSAAKRAFYTASTIAGSANPYLAIFDSSRYVPLQTIEFPGNSVTGTDLLRWGSDGLAWQLSPWPSYMGGSTQIILMRGPLVQPYLGVINAVPGLTSVVPTNVTAGSGNVVLTVTGTNFVPGATVSWNGNERTTTFTDATHLRVAIPASDVATKGSAALTVTNPGTNSSTGVTFTIN